MVKLSVNINKIATIRNARGGNNPDIAKVALDCERFGADGITVHPRPDERHIKKADVFALAPLLHTEFNIEGFPSPDFLALVNQIKPQQVTLVPDPPHALTSNTGWDTVKQQAFLKDIIEQLKPSGARVSVFLNPDPSLVEAALQVGANRIELYTGNYAQQFNHNPSLAIKPFIETATEAANLGIGLNAGHDLDLNNLNYFANNIPNLLEVSIGHALVCDALYFGLENTIQLYKRQLR